MILRKPYAFFIKIFKPIHIILSLLVAFLIYRTSIVLGFFNEFINSNASFINSNANLISLEMYLIPIIIIFFSLIFFGIMFSKKKPVLFYLFTSFSFFIILIITFYIQNYLSSIGNTAVQIKIIKLIHDLIVINEIMEIASFLILFIRGIGLDLKKLKFDSDISKMDISDKDKEEFELKLNIDLDTAKRDRKRKIRIVKYFYKENKITIYISLIAAVFVMGLLILLFNFNKTIDNGEKIIFNASNIDIRVNNSFILNESYTGEKITENQLLFVNVSLKSTSKNNSLENNKIYLQSPAETIKPTKKYNNDLIDLGNVYNNNILTNEFSDYFFVFEISDNYIKEDFYLIFVNKGNKIKIKLSPQKIDQKKENVSASLKEKMTFSNFLKGIEFQINDIDIAKKFLVKYNFCIKQDCIVSKEYISPSINENFDKVILKLNLNYKNKSRLNFKKFYNFFSSFGTIKYRIGDTWYVQKRGFEELESKKASKGNNVYIGVNSNVLNAESIILVFDIRGSVYEYKLK